MIAWLLGLLTLVGIVILAAGVFGLRSARGPAQHTRYRWMFGFSIVILAASAYFGWPGPFGAPGTPLGSGPDVPRSQLRRVDPAEVALNAVGPSNRSADPRVVVRKDRADARADRIQLIVRADDAAGPAELKDQVRRDTWTILRTLYRDRRLDRLQEIVIHATHPSGTGGADDGQTAGGEPVVAEVIMTRPQFNRVDEPDALDPAQLDRVADVRWLPPLE